MNVLLIEDNPGDARLVREMLKETAAAATIDVAEKLGAGLQFLASKSVDAVLLDLSLPDSQGLATVSKLLAQFPHLPVVVMTSFDDTDLARSSVRLGAQDYLVKGNIQGELLKRVLIYAIERKRAEHALKRSLERFELLSQIAGELLRTPATQEVIDSLCRRVMTHLDCHAFFNYLVDPEAGKLRLNSCAGIPDHEARRIEWLDYGVAVCGCVARDGTRIVAERIADTHDDRMDLVRSYGIRAYACHPIVGTDGKTLGTLSFGTRSRDAFSDEDLALMKAVTDQVAVAMVRMNDELLLRKSEALFCTLTENSPDCVALHDSNLRHLYVNPAITRLSGLPQQAFLGKTVREIALPPEVAETLDTLLRHVLDTGRETSGDLTFPSAHSPLSFQWKSVPVFHPDGSVRGVLAIASDITARKNAEAAIRRHLEELQTANADLARFNAAAEGRELRMIEMKKEINALCERIGEQPRYRLDFEKESL